MAWDPWLRAEVIHGAEGCALKGAGQQQIGAEQDGRRCALCQIEIPAEAALLPSGSDRGSRVCPACLNP
jgi:hypothetical protein